jgi:hypothetical protein
MAIVDVPVHDPILRSLISSGRSCNNTIWSKTRVQTQHERCGEPCWGIIDQPAETILHIHSSGRQGSHEAEARIRCKSDWTQTACRRISYQALVFQQATPLTWGL